MGYLYNNRGTVKKPSENFLSQPRQVSRTKFPPRGAAAAASAKNVPPAYFLHAAAPPKILLTERTSNFPSYTPPEPSEAGPVGRGGAAERAKPAACGGRRDTQLMPAARSAIPFFKEGTAFFDTLNRKTVRRALGLTAALLLAALLTGCGGPGSIYANYQNVEDLLPVQVLGLDGAADAPELSCLAAPTEEGGSPLGLAASGSGVESALQALRESSPGKVLYFSHVQYILAGEALAAEGLLPLLDYMERMPTIRMHTPLVVVQGDTAAAAVLPGEGGTDTAALLDALSQELALRGDSRMYTCREIARALAERGAALCCAVTAETAADFRPGAEGVQLIPAGYGVLKGGALAGYLTGDAALGASLIQGNLGELGLTLPGGVSVKLDGTEFHWEAHWNEDGVLTGLTGVGELRAAVTGLSREMDLQDPGVWRELSRQLSALAEGWAKAAAAACAELDADCLGLGAAAERARPLGAAPPAAGWLRTAPLRFSITAQVGRTYGLDGALPIGGGTAE